MKGEKTANAHGVTRAIVFKNRCYYEEIVVKQKDSFKSISLLSISFCC